MSRFSEKTVGPAGFFEQGREARGARGTRVRNCKFLNDFVCGIMLCGPVGCAQTLALRMVDNFAFLRKDWPLLIHNFGVHGKPMADAATIQWFDGLTWQELALLQLKAKVRSKRDAEYIPAVARVRQFISDELTRRHTEAQIAQARAGNWRLFWVSVAIAAISIATVVANVLLNV